MGFGFMFDWETKAISECIQHQAFTSQSNHNITLDPTVSSQVDVNSLSRTVNKLKTAGGFMELLRIYLTTKYNGGLIFLDIEAINSPIPFELHVF